MYANFERLMVKILLYVLILALIILIPAAAFAQEDNPVISIKKYISTDDGTNWLDANTAGTGPHIAIPKKVLYKFVVTNSGNVVLTVISLTDNKLDLSEATIISPLEPGVSFDFIKEKTVSTIGQHWNKATVTAVHQVYQVSATDLVYFNGYSPSEHEHVPPPIITTPSPSISVKKHVSVDNAATWFDAETIAAGPDAVVGAKVKFRFKVTNTGNVSLSNITLTDSEYSLGGITVPSTLAPGASFEGTIEVTAVKGRHVNTATVTGRYDGQTYSDTDKANYYGYVPITPPPKPEPVEPTPTPTPEPEKPKPKPTPPTDGAYTSGLYYALVLFALAAIVLKKELLLSGIAVILNKKH